MFVLGKPLSSVASANCKGRVMFWFLLPWFFWMEVFFPMPAPRIDMEERSEGHFV